MKNYAASRTSLAAIAALFLIVLGCGQTSKEPQWSKGKVVAGKAQGLAHISNLVLDEKYAYVLIGGTVADSNEGTNGLRKVDLATGAVTILDDGKRMPQSEHGGLAADEKFLYWNAAGNILRIAKEGGTAEAVVTENVGIGIDIAVDNERIYWTNHGYYSPGKPAESKPVYSAVKTGGRSEIFADQQMVPGSVVTDERFVFWRSVSGISKRSKAGGQIETVLSTNGNENVSEIVSDGDELYFAFRADGDSRFSLRKVSKGGGETIVIAKTMSAKPFVIDDVNIYFFDEASTFSDGLFKVEKRGGEVSRLDTGYASGAIAQSKTTVFFATLDDIIGFQK